VPDFSIPSDLASSVGRASHDVALAALLGGNLFGRIAMSPALEDISDKSERGRVLNRAWRRYGTVNSLSLATLVAGWLPARLNETRPRWLSPTERRLAVAKDVAVGAVVVTGLASAVGGVRFAQQAPGGAVPMESGRDSAPETPARAAGLKRAVNVLGALNLCSELCLVVVNASLSQAGFRRPPVRRVLRRRY
jgi:hypothetical protein